MSDPFHRGEREIQELTGERGRAILNGRLIAHSIPAKAMTFLARQQYCVLGWVSPEGDIWSSFVTGRRGLASADEAGTTLSIDLGAENAPPRCVSPLGAMRKGDHLGVLFIEFATRRRLRVNGQISELSQSGLRLSVAEAFPNCPKYIQRREANQQPAIPDSADITQGCALNDEAAAWIAAADTFFVASAHPDGPADVSHRGGKPGFVKLEGGNLHIPDYPGNSMFGTLGNFAVNPRAGLVFIDFPSNRQLQLTGDVRLHLEAGESAGETGGAGRWWVFSPRRWIISHLRHSLSWSLLDNSPFNP